MQRMRHHNANGITMLGTMPPNKGISSVCVEQAKHLAQRTAVTVLDFKRLYPKRLYPGGSPEQDQLPISLPGVAIERRLAWNNPLTWIAAGFSVRTSVLYVHWWSWVLFLPTIVVIALARARQKKIVCSIHNLTAHETVPLDRFFTSAVLRLSHEVLCHWKDGKERLIERFGLAPERVKYAPFGVLTCGNERVSKEAARKKLALPEECKVLLFFGNIRRYKGLDTLLSALAAIKEQLPDVILLVAGSAWLDWQKVFQPLVSSKQLENHVVARLGYIAPEEVHYFFSAADVLILPYLHFEAQSAVGLAALGCGLPIIASCAGGLPELVAGEQAYLFPPGDAKALSERVIQFFQSGGSFPAEELRRRHDWNAFCDVLLGKRT